MKDVLVLADEPVSLLSTYQRMGYPIGWIGSRMNYPDDLARTSAFLLRDPAGTLEPLEELRAVCRARELNPIFVAGTNEDSVIYAARWAEALNIRGACHTGLVDFFYDKLAMRRALGDHRWNVASVGGHELDSLTGDGPWIVKPRRGRSSRSVRRCDSVAAIRRAIGESNPREWIVERWVAGREITMDVFVLDGEHRLNSLSETIVDERHIEIAHIAGPVLPEDVTADMVGSMGELLSARGHREGPIHAEFRIEGDIPRLIELHPRPGGCELPHLGILTGAVNLIDCYRSMLHGERLPSDSFPSRWAYQRYTKALPLGEDHKRVLSQRCPTIEFLEERPTSDGEEITETGDWDMFMRVTADDEAELRARMDIIEKVAFDGAR